MADGSHTEKFALQNGRHPAEMLPKNIENCTENQVKEVGLMVDWGRQVDTTNPNY